MFPKIRWRITAAYAILIFLMMSGLTLYLFRPVCINNPACIFRGVWGTAVLMALLSAALAFFVATRTVRPIRQLAEVARRIAAGDLNARILPLTRDEMSDLTLAFNDMMEQLGEHITALSEEQQRLAMVLDHMADGVLIADEWSQVRLINPAAARLLKTTEAAALGRSIAEVMFHHQLIGLWQRCRAEGTEQVAAVEVGRDLFLQAVVTPVPQKGARGHLVILQDLTTIRRLETVRRDFISNLSHELRTPLASLRAVVETLQDSALNDPPAAQRFLHRAAREADTLTQMVEELLELSRIESGQVPLRLATTAVADLVQVPLDRLRSQAERGELTLALELPEDLPRVLADAERVQQVVTNLVHNAIKFTPAGGRVTVRAYAYNEHPRLAGDAPANVVIEVKDTGVGIPAEDLTRIFERFYKSDRARTRSRGGTGLGLAIARHIVQAHHGRLWAESKEGKGSTFYFSLPVSN